MNPNQVAERWVKGMPGKGFNMHTDGQNLWSYNKIIGRTLADGTKQVLNLRGYYGVSVSTSKHVGHALRAVNYREENIIEPLETNKWGWDRFDFPHDSSIVYVRNTAQTWRTRQGAEKHASISQIVQPVSGGYSVFYKQYVNSIGKVVSDAEYWAEIHE